MKPVNKCCPKAGFTLIELLIILIVGLIAIGAVFSVYTVQQRFYRYQKMTLQAQQNQRGAMAILEQQVRLAGYDPLGTGRFGITDVRRYDTVGTQPDEDGQPALFYTVDKDENGVLDSRNHFNNGENLNFRIRDDQKIGRRYLAFDMGSGRQPLAENICAMGFAYAVDVDRNGHPDTWNSGSQLIWAVDSDNDNLLDTHLDVNDDGRITTADDIDGDLKITIADGATLSPPVELDRICAVRIWLLSITDKTVPGHLTLREYVVGDRIISQPMDEYGRKLLEGIVYCRNL